MNRDNTIALVAETGGEVKLLIGGNTKLGKLITKTNESLPVEFSVRTLTKLKEPIGFREIKLGAFDLAAMTEAVLASTRIIETESKEHQSFYTALSPSTTVASEQGVTEFNVEWLRFGPRGMLDSKTGELEIISWDLIEDKSKQLKENNNG